MLKLFVTLVLLGAFLGQSKGDVGDACYDCTWDSSDPADTTNCLTITDATKKDLLATTDEPYCYTSIVGTKTTRGITSLNVCGAASDPLVTAALTFSTCSGELCNDGASDTFSPTVEACDECEDCKEPTDSTDPTDCSACPAGNSGTKATRGFGVIMTSVSLSYVITKFL